MNSVTYRGVESGVPGAQHFGLESESLIWRRLQLRALSVLSGLLCNFVAVCLNFVQFILQLKLSLYTTVHLLLEEFKNFSPVILKYTIMSEFDFGPAVGVGVLNFLTLESELHKKTRVLHPWTNTLITWENCDLNRNNEVNWYYMLGVLIIIVWQVCLLHAPLYLRTLWHLLYKFIIIIIILIIRPKCHTDVRNIHLKTSLIPWLIWYRYFHHILHV